MSGLKINNRPYFSLIGIIKIFLVFVLILKCADAGTRTIHKPGKVVIASVPLVREEDGGNHSQNRTIECITSGIDKILMKISPLFNSVFMKISPLLTSVLNKVNSTVSDLPLLVNQTLNFIPLLISSKINSTFSGFTSKLDAVNSTVSKFPNLISTKLNEINETVSEIPIAVNQTLTFLPTLITSIGSLVDQFATLITNVLSSVFDSAQMPSFLKNIIDKFKMTTGIGLDKPAGGGCNNVDVLLLGNLPGIFIGVPLVILGIAILVGAIAAVIIAIGGLGKHITGHIYDDLDFENLGNHDQDDYGDLDYSSEDQSHKKVDSSFYPYQYQGSSYSSATPLKHYGWRGQVPSSTTVNSLNREFNRAYDKFTELSAQQGEQEYNTNIADISHNSNSNHSHQLQWRGSNQIVQRHRK